MDWEENWCWVLKDCFEVIRLVIGVEGRELMVFEDEIGDIYSFFFSYICWKVKVNSWVKFGVKVWERMYSCSSKVFFFFWILFSLR